jgi:EmrB/QacA subfamily drug resistance transporter
LKYALALLKHANYTPVKKLIMNNSKARWIGLVLISLALAIVIIDGTILNVSQRAIIGDLGAQIKDIQWAQTLYTLVVTALTIVGGRLGDLFGKKRVFLVGAGIFAIGSLITVFAQNFNQLLIGWSVVEGIGAALMLPATISLLIQNFEGKERGIAFGIWGMAAGTSAAIGPMLGGYFTELDPSKETWRLAFLINVVIIFALFLLMRFIIDNGQKKKEQLDFVGVALSAVGLGAVSYGIVESSTYGWLTAKKDWLFNEKTYALWGSLSVTFYLILLGLGFLVAFYFWELRVRKSGGHPLVNFDILKNMQYVTGILTLIALVVGQTGIIFSLAPFLQFVLNKNAFESGLAFLPLSLTALVLSPIAGILSNKIKPKYIVIAGLTASLVGSLVLYTTLKADVNWPAYIIGLMLFGVGFGAVNGPLSTLTLSKIKPQEYGEASGINSMMRQLGSTLGTALIGAFFFSAIASNIPVNLDKVVVPPSLVGKVDIAKIKDGLKDFNDSFSADGKKESIESRVKSSLPPSLQSDRSQPIIDARSVDAQVKTAINESIIQGNKDSLLYTMVFLVGAILVATRFKTSTIAIYDKKEVAPSGGH